MIDRFVLQEVNTGGHTIVPLTLALDSGTDLVKHFYSTMLVFLFHSGVHKIA